MVPRESGTHLQRQKQTEIMIFWAICSIASFHLLKAAREIVIQKSIMIDKDQSSFWVKILISAFSDFKN